MKFKFAGGGLLLVFFLASCAAQNIRDKDKAVDEALGTGGLEEEADEAHQALQQAQTRRYEEQQKQLERQITDPTIR